MTVKQHISHCAILICNVAVGLVSAAGGCQMSSARRVPDVSGSWCADMDSHRSVLGTACAVALGAGPGLARPLSPAPGVRMPLAGGALTASAGGHRPVSALTH